MKIAPASDVSTAPRIIGAIATEMWALDKLGRGLHTTYADGNGHSTLHEGTQPSIPVPVGRALTWR